MIECTVDTHILAEILMQYNSALPFLPLIETEILQSGIVRKLNTCICSEGVEGIIASSAFAFIEIINQFDTVSRNGFSISKLLAFIQQPPDWFIVEPYNLETNYHLIKVPKINTIGENVELADAIHVATALQRGPNTMLLSLDGVLSRINFQNLNIVFLNN